MALQIIRLFVLDFYEAKVGLICGLIDYHLMERYQPSTHAQNNKIYLIKLSSNAFICEEMLKISSHISLIHQHSLMAYCCFLKCNPKMLLYKYL